MDFQIRFPLWGGTSTALKASCTALGWRQIWFGSCATHWQLYSVACELSCVFEGNFKGANPPLPPRKEICPSSRHFLVPLCVLLGETNPPFPTLTVTNPRLLLFFLHLKRSSTPKSNYFLPRLFGSLSY